METSSQVNQFTVFDNSLIQDKTEYNKYITWIGKYKNVNKRGQQPYIFICDRFGACREEYKLLNLKQIRDRIKKGKCLYEIVYMCRYVKPYLDIDVKGMDIDEVKQIYKYFVDKLKESGITYNIGGYTNIKGLLANCVEYKEEATKQLSLHITGLSHYVEHDKVLAYWLDYVGIDTKYIKSNVFDISVYKDYTKQQKFRIAFCHKEPNDKINISNMFVIGEDRIRSYTVDEDDDERFTSFLITWINEDMEYMDLTNSLTNQQYRDKLNGKHNKIVNTDGNINNAKEDNKDYGEYVYNPSTPLLTEEQLTRLLNLFEPDFDKSFANVLSPLANSPYPLYLLLRVVNNWYNQRPRANPKNAINYIKTYYKYNPSDKWFFTILDNYYSDDEINVDKIVDWSEEKENIYKELKAEFKVGNNKVKKNLVIQNGDKTITKEYNYKTILNERYTQISMSYDNLPDELIRRRKTMLKFKNEFKALQRLIKSHESSNRYSRIFKDDQRNFYYKDEDGLMPYSPDRCREYISENNMDKGRLSIIEPDKYDYITKYNGIFFDESYLDKVKEGLNIFASGFILEEDYIYFMRWVSAKLNNPKTVLPRNLVCLDGTGSFKTRFIEKLRDFVSFSKVHYNNDTMSAFNDWGDASIVMIDEIPKFSKNYADVQNTIKQMVGCDTIAVNKKYAQRRVKKNIANYIINSNYVNCGGIFNDTAGDEMFRRFKIIKKQEMGPEKDKLFNYLEDYRFLFNLQWYIKNNFTPMNMDEYNHVSEMEEEYKKDMVRDNSYNYKVLTLYDIERCVSDKNRLKLSELVRLLNLNNCNTRMADERSTLFQMGIIRRSGNNYHVEDKNKLLERYLRESEDDSIKEDV